MCQVCKGMFHRRWYGGTGGGAEEQEVVLEDGISLECVNRFLLPE